jgi:hypothetical protein
MIFSVSLWPAAYPLFRWGSYLFLCTPAIHVATIAKTNYWADLRRFLLAR